MTSPSWAGEVFILPRRDFLGMVKMLNERTKL